MLRRSVAGIAISVGLLAVFAGRAPGAPGERPLARCPILRVHLAAYALEDGTLRYRGLHMQQVDGAVHRIIERFTDLRTRTVLRAAVRYRAEDLRPIAYELHLPLLGRAEWLRQEGDAVVLGVREHEGADPDSERLALTRDSLFAPTVVPYMLRHWKALVERRERLVFRLLVPTRTERYDFAMERDEDTEPAAADRIVIRMEPESLLVRQVVDPVYFLFEPAAPYRLLEYRGRTPIRDRDGEPQHLRIAYRYRNAC